MIIVAGTLRIRPDQRRRAQRLARDMMRDSRAEAGCLEYTFSADLDDPELYWLYEAWESEEALAAHYQTAHMLAFREQLPELLTDDPDIQHFRVASPSGPDPDGG